MISLTPFTIAQQFVGTRELSGNKSEPLILSFLQCCDRGAYSDEIPWCSGFVNFICKLSNLPRSKSLAAKSWLGVGRPINLLDATVGYDIVVFHRTKNPALGHVGFFAGFVDNAEEPNSQVWILGGNQDNSVSLQSFSINDIAGVRRLI